MTERSKKIEAVLVQIEDLRESAPSEASRDELNDAHCSIQEAMLAESQAQNQREWRCPSSRD